MGGTVCTKCGHQNPPGAIFCQQCGELLPLETGIGDETLGPTMPDYQLGQTMPDSKAQFGSVDETIKGETPPIDPTRPAAGLEIIPPDETVIAQPATTQIASDRLKPPSAPALSVWQTPWPYLFILLGVLAVVLCGIASFIIIRDPSVLTWPISALSAPTPTPYVAILTPASTEPISETLATMPSGSREEGPTQPYTSIPTSTPLGISPPVTSAKSTPSGPTPTYTFTPPPTLTPSPTIPLTPTPFSCPGAPEPRLTVGGRGRVTFTSGLPVRIRAAPGLSGAFVANMAEGTEFDVIGGPECVNGFVWWQVRTPTGIIGWSAEGDPDEYYLEPWP